MTHSVLALWLEDLLIYPARVGHLHKADEARVPTKVHSIKERQDGPVSGASRKEGENK